MRLLIVILAFALAPVVFTYLPIRVFVGHQEAIEALSTQVFWALEFVYCLFVGAIIYGINHKTD